MPSRPPAHFIDAAPVPECMFERGSERIGNEAQCVQEIAFPSSIRPHQKSQRAEPNVARGEALVILQGNPRQQRGICHDSRPKGRRFLQTEGITALLPILAHGYAPRDPRITAHSETAASWRSANFASSPAPYRTETSTSRNQSGRFKRCRMNSVRLPMSGLLACVLVSGACNSPAHAIRPVIYARDDDAALAMRSASEILLVEVSTANLSGNLRNVNKPTGMGGPMTRLFHCTWHASVPRYCSRYGVPSTVTSSFIAGYGRPARMAVHGCFILLQDRTTWSSYGKRVSTCTLSATTHPMILNSGRIGSLRCFQLGIRAARATSTHWSGWGASGSGRGLRDSRPARCTRHSSTAGPSRGTTRCMI